MRNASTSRSTSATVDHAVDAMFVNLTGVAQVPLPTSAAGWKRLDQKKLLRIEVWRGSFIQETDVERKSTKFRLAQKLCIIDNEKMTCRDFGTNFLPLK